MLFGCSPKKSEIKSQQGTTPSTPDKVTSPLPSGSGIDWNKTVSGGGNTNRPIDATPFYYTVAFNPPCTYDEYTDNSEGSYFSISKPVFDCFSNDDVNKSVNEFIENSSEKFFQDAQTMLSMKNDPENNLYYHKNGYGGFYVETVGNYVNINFERMLNCYSYSKDENGYEVYKDQVITEFTNELCCISLKTGKLLTIEDIFYDDCDMGKLLGIAIASALDSWDTSLKRPFRGLPANWTNFCLSNEDLKIAFPQQNPYTTYGSVIAIPLWRMREHIFMEDTDMSLIKELGEEDFADFVSKPYTSYLTNTDFRIVTMKRDGIDIMQLLQHKEGSYATDAINVEIEKLCRDIVKNIPTNTVFDYEPAINSECYVIANIATVTLSLSYSQNGIWSINELRATFDLESGKRYKAGDFITFSPQLYDSISYVTVPIPENIAETDNLSITAYGGAIFGWDNGNASAFVDAELVNKSLWRNIK